MSDYGPSIKLTQLYERESRNGNRYFAGRLGYAKIVVLKSDRTAEDGTPIWDVLMQEAPLNGKHQKSDRAPAGKASSETPEKPANRGNVNAPLNDEIPF
jgi:hypothetical protein